MLERLVVRAELSAFERSLRERVERIAAMDDERLARPRSIERTHDGALVVLSEFVPGSRLFDLLDATEQHGTVPGVDVAIGFLLDVLPALCGLHAGAGFAHGAISAGRTVLTPAGQVVLLDGIFGDALSRLQYSRHRLWDEFGVAMPPAAGRPRFDASCDIAQVALSAVMLVLGRPIAAYEYPDSIPSLLVEVVDVAQIRGSSEFAAGLQRFLQRSLPLPSRRPYSAADDALIDVRELARSLGLEGCRRALVEFIEQQQEADLQSTAIDRLDEDGELSTAYSYSYGSDEPGDGSNGHGLDDLEADADPDHPPLEVDLDLDAHAEHEDAAIYDLNTGVSFTLDEPEKVEPVAYDPEPREDSYVDAAPLEEAVVASAPVVLEEPVVAAEPVVPVDVHSFRSNTEPEPEPPAAAPEPIVEAVAPPVPEPEPAPVPELVTASVEAPPVPPAVMEPPVPEPDVTTQPAEEEPAAFAPQAEEDSEHEDASAPVADDEPIEESRSARRRKRSRSARSRKDKLRSTARPEPLIPPPAPPPPAPRAHSGPPAKTKGSGWLVEPSRAAAFEPAAPVPSPPPAPPPVEAPKLAPPIAVAPPPPLPPPPPPPMVHVVAPPPPPPPQMPRPIVPPPVAPPIALQRPPMPAPISAPPPPPPASSAPSGSGPLPALKLKTEAPAGYAPKRPRPEAEDVYGGRPILQSPPESTSAFPWKLASAALVLMVVGVVVGRAYLTDSAPSEPPVAAPVEAAPPPPVEPAPVAAAKTGRVQVTTQPPGAKVLLDGKHVGDSPLTLEVPAGRHTITMAAASGSVRRTIRVDAGKTVAVDAPIFSGWVDVVAPIILDVVEDGKSIGTTEQSRLLLKPGRHELTFSNRDLDYTSTHTVDIEPGEVQTLNLDPRGTANLNATPWAEVWLNGKKVGDTPLANLRLPLGTHEVVFKHPQFGERRVTTTIRANAPVAVSVDMSKQ